MVRVISIGVGGPESCPPESLEVLKTAGARYHAVPGHPSQEWLARMGFPCEDLPKEGVPDGSILVLPIATGEGESKRNERERRAEALEALVQVVDRLLGPGGCPWDREQTHETLKKHLIEECYEVIEAIDSGNPETLKEELGDLLLQPIMHAQMERAAGGYDVADVAIAIHEKLVRRHPHVFGAVDVADADEVLKNWDKIKQNEKGGAPESILVGVPRSLPSLHRAFEVSKRAARVGFEWPDMSAVFQKLEEEESELKEALAADNADSEAGREAIASEVGDLLFTLVNVARWANVEPEEALRKMVNRFITRFQSMEADAGKELRSLSAEEWDALWNRAKLANSPQVS